MFVIHKSESEVFNCIQYHLGELQLYGPTTAVAGSRFMEVAQDRIVTSSYWCNPSLAEHGLLGWMPKHIVVLTENWYHCSIHSVS